MTSKIWRQQLKLNFCRERKARAKFQAFRAAVPPVFIEKPQRLAQCSVSETLKGFFFLVRFSFDLKRKMNNRLKEVLLWILHK